jgi:hypothetical protein
MTSGILCFRGTCCFHFSTFKMEAPGSSETQAAIHWTTFLFYYEVSSSPTSPFSLYLFVLLFWAPLWSSGQSSFLHNGDVLCFLCGMNWIYICDIEESRPALWSSGQSSWLHNGDVLCFLWGTNWIYIRYVEESRPPLWSSCQEFLAIKQSCIVLPARYKLYLYMLCTRK